MYLKHYHLKKKPFGLTPGPDFFWLSEKHKEALATLRYGVIGDLGFLLLTGEVGVGKTALIHRLLSSLDSTTVVAHITDPGLGINDFFRLLAAEFGIDTPFASKGEFLIILERFLRQADKDHKKVLLIVDEAQRVNNVLLDQIRVLSNIELNDRKLINIFFIGQPEFKNILLASINRPIRQRIAIYYHVQPLTEAETGQYVAHRLKIAGAKQKIFKSSAIHEIHRISQGFPRAINILCDHALLTCFASGSQTIDSKIIKECENELNIDAPIDFAPPVQTPPPTIKAPIPASTPEATAPPSQRARAWAYPAVIAAGAVLVALAGYYFLWSGPDGPLPMQEATGPLQHQALDAPADKPAPQPAVPQPETVLAPAESREENSNASNPGQTKVEPPVEPETIPTLSIPTPPPEVSMATPETAPIQPPASADDQSPTKGIPSLDEAGAETLLAATVDQSEAAGKQSTTDIEAPSPGVPREPLATVESTATENEAVVPTDEPLGRTVEQPAPPPSPQTTAKPDSSMPPSANTPVDGPAAVPATQPPTPTDTDELKATADGIWPPAPTTGPASRITVADRTPPTTNTQASPRAPTTVHSAKQEIGDLAPTVAIDTPANNDLSATPVGVAIPATAALQPPIGGSDPTTVEKPAVDEALENRLRSFLQSYCSTYASKDLDSFRRFFSSDAMENGKPFESLLPKYKKNFTFIDTIYYRIELQQATYEDDGKTLKIDGDFFLRWLPPDKTWRENAGKIIMNLKADGASFLVHRLEYHSNRSKNN